MRTLIKNGTIVDPASRICSKNHLLLEDGKVLAVGGEAEAWLGRPDCQATDLGGRTVVPGFHDSHQHFLCYAIDKEKIDFFEAKSLEDMAELTRAYIEKYHVPKGAWIQGGGWNENNFADRTLPTPAALDIPTVHMARLAVVGFLATLCTQLTGLSTGVTFLVGGILFGAIGFVEPGALKRAGGEGLLMLATYASVAASFVSMTFAQFGQMLFPVLGLLVMGAVGVMILSSIAGKLLKWSPWLSIAVGLSCMFGYPVTYAIAMEVSAGVTKGKGFTEEEEQRVVKHLLPKMIVAGTVSVSIASVLLAGAIIPMVFG